MPELFIGLMSGTSLDGIDVALVDLSSKIHVRSAATFPFPAGLRKSLQQIISQPSSVTLDDVGRSDALLGATYATAIQTLLAGAGVAPDDVTAVGCHGQTIRHMPTGATPFTWQLGDPNQIAAITGIPVVSDFRRMDMALGGQGAPLVPAFHAAIFKSTDELRAIVNIGGIANMSRLGSTVIGYDVGPGNILMDAWIRHQRGDEFDCDGSWAATGKIDDALLSMLQADPFFTLPPPRSTGPEHFNLDWLSEHLGDRMVSAADVQATLLALTTESIAREVLRSEAQRVLLCGGGARNKQLRKALTASLQGIPVETTDDHGIDADFVEAAAFAWLARERIAGRPGNMPSVTGASRPAILGAVYHP